jgi:hypothetical protein
MMNGKWRTDNITWNKSCLGEGDGTETVEILFEHIWNPTLVKPGAWHQYLTGA